MQDFAHRLHHLALDVRDSRHQVAYLAIVVGSVSGRARACSSNSSLSLGRSILPLTFFGRASKGSHREGTMYAGRRVLNRDRNVAAVTSWPVAGAYAQQIVVPSKPPRSTPTTADSLRSSTPLSAASISPNSIR